MSKMLYEIYDDDTLQSMRTTSKPIPWLYDDVHGYMLEGVRKL